MRFHRLQAGYYYSHNAVTVQGINSHIVIEESDSKAYWTLRIESIPGLASTHKTYKHAKYALADLIKGSLELVLS